MQIENEQVSGETAVETKPINDFVTHGEEETEAPAEEAPAEENAHSEDDDSQDKPNEDGKKPKRGGFQKKIGRLEATVEFLTRELERTRPGEVKTEPSVQSDNAGLPKEDDFETFAEYNAALIEHAVDQRMKKAETEKAQVQSIQSKVDTYNKLTTDLKTERPDFDKLINESDLVVTPAIRAAILDSDMGPRVTLYLAENPEEAEGLAELGTIALNKKIAKIEAKLEFSKTPPKVAAKTTQAPAPINPVGNGKGNNVVTNVDDMSFDDYKAARNAGRI